MGTSPVSPSKHKNNIHKYLLGIIKTTQEYVPINSMASPTVTHTQRLMANSVSHTPRTSVMRPQSTRSIQSRRSMKNLDIPNANGAAENAEDGFFRCPTDTATNRSSDVYEANEVKIDPNDAKFEEAANQIKAQQQF